MVRVSPSHLRTLSEAEKTLCTLNDTDAMAFQDLVQRLPNSTYLDLVDQPGPDAEEFESPLNQFREDEPLGSDGTTLPGASSSSHARSDGPAPAQPLIIPPSTTTDDHRFLNNRLPRQNNHHNHRHSGHDCPDRCFHDLFTLTLGTQTCRNQELAQKPTQRTKRPRVQGHDDFDERLDLRQKQRQAVFSKRLVGKTEKVQTFPTKKLSENRRPLLLASLTSRGVLTNTI